MNLKRQLLLVSLLTLVLPWAGCRFIAETESALRDGQQQMLAGTARAIADSLAQYAEEFSPRHAADHLVGDQLYGHTLAQRPAVDGYYDDWELARESLRGLRGSDGPIRFALGFHDDFVYLYVEVSDRQVVYTAPGTAGVDGQSRFADRVSLVNASPPYLDQTLHFAAEAPGAIITYSSDAYGFAPEPRIRAFWQDVPGGYQLEAQIPASLLGTHLGLVVANTADERQPPVRSASYAARSPGPFVRRSKELDDIIGPLAQRDMRLIVTDAAGWRVASTGQLTSRGTDKAGMSAAWLRIAYNAVLEAGKEAELAEPDPTGREQQAYITDALDGRESVSWFRSRDSGRAVVAVAEPVSSGDRVLGAIVLQQGTDAILSLRSEGLTRLLNVSLVATLVVAGALLGYATWLSRRIRQLSQAAEAALDRDELRLALPSATAGDEVGDLSRSFSRVLRQLGDYNEYLRSLASKLSHELRTPLAIVSSSLENLEHEALNETAAGYTARARDGAERLRRILTAMSEANRVEELMANADPEDFDLRAVLESTTRAYRDAYTEREFAFEADPGAAPARGSPELLIQLLDKLVDNAVDFSGDGDTISIALATTASGFELSVSNPGQPLPERMRSQLFDSMVSVRPGDDRHLGLGLYIARLIAEGHGGSIGAANTPAGVTFSVSLPRRAAAAG